MRQNSDQISTISCFSKPLPLRGTVPKTKTKTGKSQDKSKSSARCPTRVPCQVAHGDSERLQSHTDALRRHPPHRACGFRGVWLLILWVAPRLNPRQNPNITFKPGPRRKTSLRKLGRTKGLVLSPLGAVTMPTRTNRAPGPLHRGDLTHEFPLPQPVGMWLPWSETVGEAHVLALGWSGTGWFRHRPPGGGSGSATAEIRCMGWFTLRRLGRGHRSLVNFWAVTRLKTVLVDSHVYREKLVVRAS